MAHLSSPIQDMRNHYEVVVIGSGYGGSITASRLARAGRQVCVLERGKEIRPGEYPDTELETTRETQLNLPQAHVGRRTALYDYHINDDMTVLVGCGLGGTSLINANVALRPDERVFDDERWPKAFRQDVGGRLEEGYRRAEEMLRPTPYPQDFPELPKLEALRKSAEAMDATFYRLPINVTFEDGVNHVGVEQRACKLCGDCAAGCNHRAKNTTLMNYLPDAHNHGAEIYTCVSVRTLERKDGRWLVHYQVLDAGQETFDAPLATVSADLLIVAAGCLGSTEILLRSKAEGLSLSGRVGDFFSGNGDVGGGAYNADVEIRSIGFGVRNPDHMKPVGPTITGVIDIRDTEEVDEGMVIEEGAISGSMGRSLPKLLANAGRLVGVDTDRSLADDVRERKRELESLIRGPYHGAVNNSQVFLVMIHDNAQGRLKLKKDRIRIIWPDMGKGPYVERVNQRLIQATRAIGGTFIENPMWSHLPRKGLVSAHPLGGCVMAEEATRGVVNHKGQVFAGDRGDEVYENFYVCDGAVIPRSIGANPLLTISAIAERTAALIATDRNWEIDYELGEVEEVGEPDPDRLGLEFTETMGGYITVGAEDYESGYRQGEQADSPFRFIVTILCDDLEQMLSDSNYTARLAGTVTAPALSSKPLTISNGRFNLFLVDPSQAGTRRMKYRMNLTDEAGRAYYMEGFKRIRDEAGADLWKDTTTLYTTVYDGESAEEPVLAQGILRIYPDDFRRQITTVDVKNASGRRERLEAMVRFGRFFAGELFDVYGGVFARPNLFDPEAPPRKKRELRTSAPEVHYFNTADGVRLRLTRYRGGDKGPVMLVHGLGVSSLAFATDTIETNMTEYLYANGYDVWLLDYRSSIEMPVVTTQHTADDIARYDWPAAVDTVRQITGADSIQVVVHCYGAITFHMAMLGGYVEGVRSAVASQVGAHVRVIPANRVKSGIYLDALLDKIGVDALTMYTDGEEGWLDRLYNRAISFNPVIAREERCNSPVCHRVTFLYAPLYEHDQLNTATHDNLHELFGVASMSNFEHVGELTRKGQLVTAEGDEAFYLEHPERLAIPITYIHGAENETWLPESTALTEEWLRAHNGKDLYRRHLIPDYGHIDCIFGKNAVNDVYPLILDHLEATQ